MGDIRLETTPDEFRSHFKRITHFPTAPESTDRTELFST